MAYGIIKHKEVYLKDTWRLDLPEFTPEGETYKWLMEKNVSNIPQCLMWGDVLSMQYHTTQTQSYVSAPWVSTTDNNFLPHRHYCLVLGVIGRTLTSFKSYYEAVQGVCDALIDNVSYSSL